MTTYKAAIDTPWMVITENGEDSYTPALAADPAFSGRIKGWRDVTGEEGAMVDGQMLYGGNYALETGIQPDSSVGRLGGSGNPDRLIIECTTDDPNLWADIDAAADYWVLWTETVEDPEEPVVLAAASLDRPREAIPPAAEFGQWRSWLGQQGIPQAWIDDVYGTGNTRNRGKNDSNGRQGYLTRQYGGVNLPAVASYLESEGWEAFLRDNRLVVWINGTGYRFTVRQLLDKIFGNAPPALVNDLEDILE